MSKDKALTALFNFGARAAWGERDLGFYDLNIQNYRTYTNAIAAGATDTEARDAFNDGWLDSNY